MVFILWTGCATYPRPSLLVWKAGTSHIVWKHLGGLFRRNLCLGPGLAKCLKGIDSQDDGCDDQVEGDEPCQPVADHLIDRQIGSREDLADDVVGRDKEGRHGGHEHKDEWDERPQVVLALR